MVSASSAHGATPKIATLHVFGSSGYKPWAGIVTDRDGNIYGTTVAGGTGSCFGGTGCGTVYRIVPPSGGGSRWTYQTLYNFQNDQTGYFAVAQVTFDDSGAVYDYTTAGSYGNVFRLVPPTAADAPWQFEILYAFKGGGGGNLLNGIISPLIVRGGHVYGVAAGGSTKCGTYGCGSVYRLDPGIERGPWTKKTLFEFKGGDTGGKPAWLAGFDAAGALYLSADAGKGAVVKLSPPAVGDGPWSESVVTTFAGGNDGRAPRDLIFDSKGSLFGLAVGSHAGDLVYQLTPVDPNDAHWTRSVVAYVKDHGYGPNSIALGRDGTLIGAIEGDFDFFAGSLFRLTRPASGSGPWTFTQLWNFNRGPDRNPLNAVPGLGGNIFSVLEGGDSTNGSVVELR